MSDAVDTPAGSGETGAGASIETGFGPGDHPVVVLGVHRSGTSLLTAGLEAIGCALGTLTNEINDENPRGFFENAGLRAINERVFRELGVSWDNWGFDATAHDFTAPVFAALRAEAADHLRSEFAGGGRFALKDPRLSSLLPFWEAVFAETGLRPRRILLVRNPREVAASQARRAARAPGMHRLLPSAEPMHALWCTMTNTILRSLPDDETLIVSHHDLYARPAEMVAVIADFLGLPANDASCGGFAGAVVDPSLRRVDAEDDPTPCALASVSGALFSAITAGSVPRRLTSDEAQAIADNASGFAALQPLLPAVARSLSGARAQSLRDNTRIGTLRKGMTTFAEIAIRESSTRVLSERRGRLETLRQDAGTDKDLFLFHEAALAERLGEWETAAELYAEAAMRAPRLAGAFVGRVRCLRRAGRASEAESCRAEAAERFPNHPAFRA